MHIALLANTTSLDITKHGDHNSDSKELIHNVHSHTLYTATGALCNCKASYFYRIKLSSHRINTSLASYLERKKSSDVIKTCRKNDLVK